MKRWSAPGFVSTVQRQARICTAPPSLWSAPPPAEKMQKVLPLLTDEEQAVYKRGRNANVHTMSRSATPAQYHSATGLECLMGYLYLKGDKNRAEELFRAMMEET